MSFLSGAKSVVFKFALRAVRNEVLRISAGKTPDELKRDLAALVDRVPAEKLKEWLQKGIEFIDKNVLKED